tara:strand:- start:2076 stop:2294 length:219 start_codon:yes stop_codon:yes gene_type:complete
MKKATLQADGSWVLTDLTSAEQTQYDNEVAAATAQRNAQAAAATKKENDKASGKAKLKELGLTDDQISALLD